MTPPPKGLDWKLNEEVAHNQVGHKKLVERVRDTTGENTLKDAYGEAHGEALDRTRKRDLEEVAKRFVKRYLALDLIGGSTKRLTSVQIAKILSIEPVLRQMSRLLTAMWRNTCRVGSTVVGWVGRGLRGWDSSYSFPISPKKDSAVDLRGSWACC
jgi:hypothetical protein